MPCRWSSEAAAAAAADTAAVTAAGRADARVRVVAAALWNHAGELLIAERPRGKPLAGRWEFPGGKVDGGESELEALRRELREELGVEVRAARHLMRVNATYPEREIELSLWIVEAFSGTPCALDGQRLKWVVPAALATEDILEADRPFIEALQTLPPPRVSTR
jgi:8-oxo-dGTP diphosphatase